jgi:hypothetical protein
MGKPGCVRLRAWIWLVAQPIARIVARELARLDRAGTQPLVFARHAQHPRAKAEILDLLASSARQSPQGLAAVFRTVRPDAGLDEFEHFLRERLPAKAVPPTVVEPRAGARRARAKHPLAALYERHAPGGYSLADRGLLARVHPLELWVASYLGEHTDAPLAQVRDASREERQQAYGWLFQPRLRAAQDSRIATLLELDAFAEIHRSWQRLGYPFDHLVPSYATAIGSSGDRPSALAELMGTIANDGLRYPTVRIERLRFGAATPYETVLQRQSAAPERVLAPEIAAVVRRALQQVVEQGTARRLRGALDHLRVLHRPAPLWHRDRLRAGARSPGLPLHQRAARTDPQDPGAAAAAGRRGSRLARMAVHRGRSTRARGECLRACRAAGPRGRALCSNSAVPPRFRRGRERHRLGIAASASVDGRGAVSDARVVGCTLAA